MLLQYYYCSFSINIAQSVLVLLSQYFYYPNLVIAHLSIFIAHFSIFIARLNRSQIQSENKTEYLMVSTSNIAIIDPHKDSRMLLALFNNV